MMAHKKRGGPEGALDKAMGRMSEAAGRGSGATRVSTPRGVCYAGREN